MPCYGDAATLDDIRRTSATSSIPPTPKGGGLPQLDLRAIDGPAAPSATSRSSRSRCCHGARPILGFRFGAFAYLTDCNRLADEAWALLDGLDVLVLDALRERPHPTHFSLERGGRRPRRASARARTFFTHMCHDLPHEPTNARLPAGMALAYDGLVLESDR